MISVQYLTISELGYLTLTRQTLFVPFSRYYNMHKKASNRFMEIANRNEIKYLKKFSIKIQNVSENLQHQQLKIPYYALVQTQLLYRIIAWEGLLNHYV